MPNPHRGEIEIILDDQPQTLRLTLGALAELETTLQTHDLLALAERFETGRLSASDAIHILGAAARGAGADLTDDAVSRMTIKGGAAGAMRAVAALLKTAFGDD